jgi:hypothetical protein
MIDIMHILGICPDAMGHIDLIELFINTKATNTQFPTLWNLKTTWTYLKLLPSLKRK